MAFYQDPPTLGNQYDDDRVLRSYLARALPREVAASITPSLREMGELAGGRLYQLQLADRANEPKLTSWDAWGRRVDQVEVTQLWKEAARIACERGVVATAYERAHGAFSRVHQFALAYLFDASSDVYTCPLAMTDGAARTLLASGNHALIDRAVPRLTSRDPAAAWTSGQWMTERTGGSDVGRSETAARLGPDGAYRLHGTKWFASSTTSEMALTLARPEGNPEGSRGLALFYVELAGEAGRREGVLINRLKDKLGTRKVPTAELTLDGVLATPVAGLSNGVRAIAPMLNVTRTWNAIGAIAGMRRGLALARSYAQSRVQFGTTLAEKPLHMDTLAELQAEFEGAFHLTFRAIELLGREETGSLTDSEAKLLRLIIPLAKLTTAKQAVSVLSEVLEAFGGAGYVEDTGLPRLLRDAQVLTIWEGTTNVLALDALRVILKDGSLDILAAEVARLLTGVVEPKLAEAETSASRAVSHARAWIKEMASADRPGLEAGARRVAITLGRALQLALLVRHAAWAIDRERSRTALAAAVQFERNGVDCIRDHDRDTIEALAETRQRPDT
ncbi:MULTISPECIES: acyl-CoA dehydrogenase family protein [Sorangium]|uniref:Acyl-CoA dehydrogenase family protein n=1 Tax=Sorangium atrum TaxID=2995308 RepID=A0ABT5BUU6_9BACT|nr:acyl-CoA dehydrogenase family protein [Sorangium aterium]MDC0677927.1 acyl-CoA dehydrogenase family protein [Sorangium aterium]